MKFRLLDFLQCSCGKGSLALNNIKIMNIPFEYKLNEIRCSKFCGLKKTDNFLENMSAKDCIYCYSQEIMEGTINCICGKEYPIIKGIPRFLPEDLRTDFKKVQNTFSYEWKMFRFGERNWGQDIEFRKNLFLQGMGTTPKELKGKLIFDAGCGSGALSIEMAASFGMEVIALDLAFGIEKAYEYNKNPFVHFLQGSVLEPPITSGVFDYVYCAGVLVALPDTRTGFKSIIRTLKKGGRCFIWVYHPISKIYYPGEFMKMTIYNGIRKHITSHLSIGFQFYLFLIFLIPVFLIKQRIEIVIGKKDKKNALTWREKMQAFLDFYPSIYQNRHTQEECIEWYQEEKFSNIFVSDIGPHGFGLYGDLN
jgi:ubiquinone/menaquinone biosynthesis C-methylase UbiE